MVRYKAHHQMQHDQGFTGSHWTPPSGDYSLRIAPLAARATINLTMIQHVLTLLAVSMAITMHRYYTTHIAWLRRFMAFIKATKRHHRTSTRSDIKKGTRQLRLFQTFHREKELLLTCWPRITIGVWHIRLTRSTKLSFQNTLLGWLNLAINHYNNHFLWCVINQ